MEPMDRALRLLELYSGIGGMRYAIECAGIPHKVIAAIDVNPVANTVYCHNFGTSNHFQRNIQSLTAEELDKMKIDIITLSPPCQPFTRVGLKKDVEDARTDSFLHILKLVTELQKKPTYFLLENVKGFEDSLAHDTLIDTLKMSGYCFQEFLLSPSNFNIPNSRLRFYLIAKLKPKSFSFSLSDKILLDVPKTSVDCKYHCEMCLKESTESCVIKHYLENKPKEHFSAFLVSDKILLKYAKVLDIVHEDTPHSCCFTKAYGRYALGTGSVFTASSSSEVQRVFQELSSDPDKSLELELLKTLNLRYFTPREVANLMCFPQSFSFPDSITDQQGYRTLGNSINVFVVSRLMKLLLED